MASNFAYCPHCGKEIPSVSGLQFCPYCGQNLSQAERSAPPGSSSSVEPQILDVLSQSGMIPAIKRYRELTGASLADAKYQVEAIAGRHPVRAGVKPASPKSGFGCFAYLIFSVWLGFMAGTAGVAVYPPLGKIASPFLCDGGLSISSNHYNPSPGTSVTTRHFYCPDGREVTFRVAFTTALLYAVITWVLTVSLVGLRRLFRNVGSKPGGPG